MTRRSRCSQTCCFCQTAAAWRRDDDDRCCAGCRWNLVLILCLRGRRACVAAAGVGGDVFAVTAAVAEAVDERRMEEASSGRP